MTTKTTARDETLAQSAQGLTSDPVFGCDEGWFFFDEIWLNTLGPYPTEAAARAALTTYAAAL